MDKIPLDQIRPNEVALRGVDVESEEVQSMIDSVKNVGILSAISVQEATDAETGDPYYEIVDGLHRYTCAKEAGLTEIPAQVVSLDSDMLFEAQMIANMHKIETKPVEYSRQLIRILGRNPLMTESELARRLARSTAWLRDRLKLNNITNEEIITLINKGDITLSNAFALAKLPEEEQPEWVERAITLPPDEFIPQATKRRKDIADANRKGKNAAPAEFSPTPHLQKIKDLKEEIDKGAVAKNLIATVKPASPEEAFALAVKWALHLDPISVEEQKATHEQKKKEQEEARRRREAASAKKKAEDKAKAAADAQAEAEAKAAEVA